MPQPRSRYEDISHFRAPYKDSVFSGFGIYENVRHGDETHGTGEYMPVSGIGEYMPVSGFGADAVPAGWTVAPTAEPTAAGVQAQPPVASVGPLFESDGHLIFTTIQGAALIDQTLAPWSLKPTAQLTTLPNGDVYVIWYVGYDVPPPDAGPASSFVPFMDIMAKYSSGGYVVLSDTTLVYPTPSKHSFLITKNPQTVADNAREGGLYFLTRGSDDKIVTAAKNILAGKPAGLSLGSLSPLQTALLVAAVGAGVMMLGKKKRT